MLENLADTFNEFDVVMMVRYLLAEDADVEYDDPCVLPYVTDLLEKVAPEDELPEERPNRVRNSSLSWAWARAAA